MRIFELNRQSIIGFIKFVLILMVCFFISPGTMNVIQGGLFFNGISAAFAEDGDEKSSGAEKGKNTDEKQAGGENVQGEEPPPCPECPDPAKVVLKGLEEKKQQIAREEAQLKQERKELEKFKEEIDESLERLTALKKQIQEDLDSLQKKKTDEEVRKEAAFEAKMNRLVKVYAGMKPKKAAEIFNQMDYEVAREIFSRMRETSAADILAFVDSEKAAKISERLAHKKK